MCVLIGTLMYVLVSLFVVQLGLKSLFSVPPPLCKGWGVTQVTCVSLCSRSQSWSPVPAGQPARIHHFEAHCAPQATQDTLPCTHCATQGTYLYSPRTRHFAHCEAPRTQKCALQKATQDTGYRIHPRPFVLTKDTPQCSPNH